MERLTLLPGWKQAVREIVDAGAIPDTILTHDYLGRTFGLTPPVTAAEQRDYELEFLKSFTRMKETLLEEHCVDLISVPGVGYQIVPPGKQTGTALDQGVRRIAKEMRNTGRRLAFVNRAALTADERRENDDAVAKVSSLHSMMKRATRRLLLVKP